MDASGGQFQHLDRRRVARIDLDRERHAIVPQHEVDAEQSSQSERLDQGLADAPPFGLGRSFRLDRPRPEAPRIGERIALSADDLSCHADQGRFTRPSDVDRGEARAVDALLIVRRFCLRIRPDPRADLPASGRGQRLAQPRAVAWQALGIATDARGGQPATAEAVRHGDRVADRAERVAGDPPQRADRGDPIDQVRMVFQAAGIHPGPGHRSRHVMCDPLETEGIVRRLDPGRRGMRRVVAVGEEVEADRGDAGPRGRLPGRPDAGPEDQDGHDRHAREGGARRGPGADPRPVPGPLSRREGSCRLGDLPYSAASILVGSMNFLPSFSVTVPVTLTFLSLLQKPILAWLSLATAFFMSM